MSSGRILVVEDQPELNELLKELLVTQGHTVIAVLDGAAALRMLESQPFDLVLLDLELPKISGLHILEELQLWPAPPKVIVMTGNNTPETILRAVKGRAYHFIVKPASNEKIREVVQNALAAGDDVPHIELVSAKPDWI